jgi:hypothetical protein
MPLFQRKRFVWNEPWFFQQRIRPAKAWVLFSLMVSAFAGTVGAILYFSAPAANLLEVIGLSLGMAFAIWWVLDGSNTRRQAVLFEDSIVVGGDMGKYSYPTTYKLSGITDALIVWPEQSRSPSPALCFRYEGAEQLIGIESKARLTHLVQALHDAGVSIWMHGWEPNQQSEFEKAYSWQAEPSQVVEKATIETLPPGTPSMMSAGGIVIAIVRQTWAIVLWLVLTGYAIYYGYQNWANIGIVQMAVLILVPIGVLYIVGEYTDRFASAATSQGLIRMAKNQFRKRNGIQLDLDAEDLLPVEIFVRDQFANTVQKIHEMGFLQADRGGQRMLFEGKQQRWALPAGSIRSLAIEEIQSGTPGQSALGAMNYYVVVRFVAEEEQEFGFRYSQRDYGEVNDIKRAEGGLRVFEAFESILSPAAAMPTALSAKSPSVG